MEDYKLRMIKEYRDLKEKYEKLHRIIIKYEAGTLDFEPDCPICLLEEQASAMGEYLRILEIRSEIEGIGYDNLLYDVSDVNVDLQSYDKNGVPIFNTHTRTEMDMNICKTR